MKRHERTEIKGREKRDLVKRQPEEHCTQNVRERRRKCKRKERAREWEVWRDERKAREMRER
jgi:hypothetical protein